MTRWYTCEELVELATPYVLGILDAEDEAAVAAGLAACPEATAEVERLGGVVPYLAEVLEPVEPPAALKGRLLAAAEADLEERRVATEAAAAVAAAAAASAPPVAVEPPIARPVVQIIPEDLPEAGYKVIPPAAPPAQPKRARPWLAWGLAAAAVLVIAALGVSNLSLRGQLDDAQGYAAAVRSVVAAATAPGAQVAVLGSEVAGGPRGIAALSADGEVVVAMTGLEPTTGSEVYETWIIGADGTPVPIGSFPVASDGLGYLPDGQGPTDPGVTVALTLEPGPGATKPSSPPVSAGVAQPGPVEG